VRTSSTRPIILFLASLALSTGCGFDPHPKSGVVPCWEGCPSGYYCGSDAKCWVSPSKTVGASGGSMGSGSHASSSGQGGNGGNISSHRDSTNASNGGFASTGSNNASGGSANTSNGGALASGGSSRTDFSSASGGNTNTSSSNANGGSSVTGTSGVEGGITSLAGSSTYAGSSNNGGSSAGGGGTGGMRGSSPDAGIAQDSGGADRPTIDAGVLLDSGRREGRVVDAGIDGSDDGMDEQITDAQVDVPVSTPALSISPKPLDFGSVTVAGTYTLAITVTSLRATATSLTFGGISGSADFANLAGGTCPNGYPALSPGAACTILMKFSPTSAGLKTASLDLRAYWSTGTSPVVYEGEDYSIAFSGTGIAGPTIDAGPDVGDVGVVADASGFIALDSGTEVYFCGASMFACGAGVCGANTVCTTDLKCLCPTGYRYENCAGTPCSDFTTICPGASYRCVPNSP
jgi:hypothetical protein